MEAAPRLQAGGLVANSRWLSGSDTTGAAQPKNTGTLKGCQSLRIAADGAA